MCPLAIFTDQTIAFNFDPGAPGTLPITITVVTMTINDANNNGIIRPGTGDQINGSNVTAVWVGDTVTINGVQITGVTFYTASGGRYFTPSGGSVLTNGGNLTATTWVNSSTQFPVGGFGPPCFVAGTRIAVPGGTVRVEDLAVGDMVVTRDHGARPIRWIGKRTVPGVGSFAPIRLAPGALGEHDELLLSPQHRVLLEDWRAQFLFGEDEVLCPAHALVNDKTIRRAPCDEVTYVHFMCDEHEIVYAEGMPSESFLFAPYLCHETSPIRAEIIALFPEFEDELPLIPSARRILRSFEGEMISRLGETSQSEGMAA